MNTEYRYTDYCTVFWFQEKGRYKVQMYDEIKDRPIKTVTVLNKESALKLIEEYIDNAPDNCICQELK